MTARLVYVPAALWLLLGVLFWRMPYYISWDAAMYLQMAEMLLKGKILYVDILDLNPPLITYLSTIPVILSGGTWHPIAVLKVILWIWTALATFLIGALASYRLDRKRAGVLAIAFLVACFHAYGEGVDGQREHLFVLSFFPYLFLRWARLAAKPRRALIYMTAIPIAITMSLKPHFLVPWILSEAYLYCRTRDFRYFLLPEICLIGGFGLIYAIHFLFIPPAMSSGFFLEIIPQVVKYYSSMDQPRLDLFTEFWPEHIFAVLFAILYWIDREESSLRDLTSILALTFVSAMICFHLQQKGWPYHMAPAKFAIILYAAARIGRAPSKLWCVESLVAAVLVATFYLPYKTVATHLQGFASVRDLPDDKPTALDDGAFYKFNSRMILSETKKGDSVVVFHPNLTFSQPILAQRRAWPGTRYMFLYPITFFHPPKGGNEGYKKWDEIGGEEKTFLERVIADINRNKPKLISFPLQKSTLLPERFNVFEYAKTAGVLDAISFGTAYGLVYQDENVLYYRRLDSQ